MVIVSSSFGGIAANAGGRRNRVSSANFQGILVSINHPQYNLIHERTSTDPASAIASALRVLTATF